MEEEVPKYLRWVNQVMSSHKAPAIDEFRVQFNLLSKHKDNVDNWVRSAIEKRVKKFQLDVAPSSFSHFGRECCGLPSLSLFTSLTSLELSRIDVSAEVLEKLLHDCPLEHLSVYYSLDLANLKVVGPSLKLKTLKLYQCHPTNDLEISAPNLTSFDYCGQVLNNLVFKSIPKLTEISIGGDYTAHVMDDPLSLSSCSSQIEVLTLEIDYAYDKKHIGRIAEAFPVWTKLKILNIEISPRYDDQLFGLLSLIKACPSLHKFVLQMEYIFRKVERTAETRNVEACPHDCLKIVEIKDFVGWEVDFGFVEYLIENAVSLEKVIIELIHYKTSYEPCLEERRTRARQQAEQLRANLKPGTELQIRNEPLLPWPSLLPF